MTKRNKIILTLLALLLALALSISFYGKLWLEGRLKAELAERGFGELAFSLSSVGMSGITFKDVALPGAVPLNIDSITVDYSLLELLKGGVRQISIPQVKFEKDGMKAKAEGLTVMFEPATGAGWRGKWSVAALDISQKDFPIPVLSGGGDWQSAGDSKLTAELKSAGDTHYANLTFDYTAGKATVTIATMRMALNGGQVQVRNTTIALEPGKAIRIPLEVRSLALDIVLKAATGGQAEATGSVSGVVPLIIQPDGSFMLGQGELKASSNGVIKLSPSAIPGDNAQVAQLRDMLQNFHYNQFSMQLKPGKDKQLSILLSLGGNNPDAYNGRELKLNVNLTGELLDLLQQSILPMTDPKQYLKEQHEKQP